MKIGVFALLAVAVTVAGCKQHQAGAEQAAQAKPSVPSKLFEIELGRIYAFKEANFTKGGLPIAKFTGAEQSIMGSGTSIYFQPIKQIEAFPYIENKKPGQEFFSTSYRAYLVPVLPANIKTLEELKGLTTQQYEVGLIEWAEQIGKDRDGKQQQQDYAWAESLCRTFEADLGIKPEVLDQWRPEGDKTTLLGSFHSCTFKEGDRQLEVNSFPGRRVTLKFTPEVSKAKEEAIEKAVRKLAAPAVRPY